MVQQRSVASRGLEVSVGRDGHWRLADATTLELMHPLLEPTEEAEALYLRHADVANRLAALDAPPLTVWDVGFGMGANAFALLRETQRCRKRDRSARRSVKLVSFEQSLEPLDLLVGHHTHFPHVDSAIISSLKRKGEWKSAEGDFRWQLIVGDFAARFAHTTRPDLIFYDPFSLRTNPTMWSQTLLSKIREYLSYKESLLITFATAQNIRARLVAAGFVVADGFGVGRRSKSTLAATSPKALGAFESRLIPATEVGAPRDR